MKIKIYPIIGDCYYVILPEYVRGKEVIDGWLYAHALNVKYW